jgi:dipeptidyl aminopeptidase/acylaminoacyl peptidase
MSIYTNIRRGCVLTWAAAGGVPIGILACGLLIGSASAGPTRDQKALFTLSDLGTLARLSKPALSPDGKQVALVVSRPDPVEDRSASTLVVMDAKTGAQQVVIVSGDARDPAWSPQGGKLAWLAPDANKAMQINIISLGRDGDSSTVVTNAQKAGIRAFAWSPNGDSFAYLAEDAPVAPAGDARFDRTFEVSDSDYLGTSNLARTRGAEPARLWLIPVQGGKARMLTTNSGYIEELAWQTDGKAVVINAHPGSSIVSERFGSVSSIDIEQGKETIVVPQPANVATEAPIQVSSQGVLAYQHYRGQDPWLYGNNVAVVTDGRSHDVTTSLDRDIIAFDWLGRSDTLLVEAPDHVRTALWQVPMSGPARPLDLGTVNPTSGVSVSRAGTLAFIGSEPDLPPELYVMASPTSKPLRLTSFNSSVLHRRLGRMQTVTWKSDNYDHDGVITYPPDFQSGQRYPMLVHIHGGPHATSRLSFDGGSQFYAANGWLVFEPNYRGSDGQGDRYQTAVIGDATAGPGRDIRAGIAAVLAMGIVDDARIAVTGYSYGGVMTSWMIGHYHDWCAAIPGGVVVDFADYYDHSDTGIWIGSLLGSPHLPENRQKYVEQSPATYLSQATTPTLIMQNVGDPNATIGQAYTLYHALKDRGVKSRFIVFGIDGHGVSDPFLKQLSYARTLAWMNENCGPVKR